MGIPSNRSSNSNDDSELVYSRMKRDSPAVVKYNQQSKTVRSSGENCSQLASHRS